jgi:hypothetical protein
MGNAVSLTCLAAVRIFIDVGRIPLRMAEETRPSSQPKMLASSLGEPSNV